MTTRANRNATQTQVSMVEVDGQPLRVGVRAGTGEGTPLLLFNGIGANLELVEPFTDALVGVETVVFDVPGVGGSPAPQWPYQFSNLAQLADRLMTQLGYGAKVDVLGVSWGGALAQEFAIRYPQRCRRLVLAATASGGLMVPGKLSVLSKMVSPRRYSDPGYMAQVGAELYGGVFRRRPELLRKHAHHMRAPRGQGYYYQQLAMLGWTSAFGLPMLRQPTLVLAGSDDPIVPLVNAKVLATLIPNARLHVVDDGHLFLLSRAREIAQLVGNFLAGRPVQATDETTP